MPKRSKPAIDRILPRVVHSDTPILGEPCWIFTGAITAAGYGLVGRGRRGEGVDYTHRITYTEMVGPIPDGLEIDHLCRVRSCCNPAHLEAVTRSVNTRRGDNARVLRERHARNRRAAA